jgi:hypothetical protein
MYQVCVANPLGDCIVPLEEWLECFPFEFYLPPGNGLI